MNVRHILGAACVVGLLGGSSEAVVTSAQDAIDKITADSVVISGWMNDQFKRAVPFNSTAGNVVPSQLKILGFEVGAEAVVSATKMDNDAFHTLGTQVIDTNQIDTFSRLPFPMILGHAKIGLPFGLDAGVRIGGIPSKSTDKDDTHIEVENKVFGIDVRKVLVEEGMARPFGLTLGLSFTQAKGHISASTPYESNDPNVTVDATGSTRNEWNSKSVGVQALINKKILFLNPYLGVGANKNFGTMDSSITNSGTVTYQANPPQSFTTVGASSAKINNWDLRAMAGLEMSILPFVRLGIGGEVASQNKVAGNIGLRVQFR